MKPLLKVLSLSFCVIVFNSIFCLAQSINAIIPEETILEIRLTQPLSSYKSKIGDPVEAVLIAPVKIDGRYVLPIGAIVLGKVADVHKIGAAIIHETAMIQLIFKQLKLPNGQVLEIDGIVINVDNSRERIDKKGRIKGVRATSTYSSRASRTISGLTVFDPMMFFWSISSSMSIVGIPQTEISLPIGTEMFIKLTRAVSVDYTPASPIDLAISTDKNASMETLLRNAPYRTYTDKKKIPSDFTNLLFIGSISELERGLIAAGWAKSEGKTSGSIYQTLRAVSNNEGYKEAPMSTLMLDDKAPNLSYEKSFNTFAKRHHMRIWILPEKWNENTMLTSSSTHDIGIAFSKSDKTFIHLIDHNIDNERAKIVNDLVFTGCVDGVSLLDRDWLPKNAKNGTGEPLLTDAKIAVVRLNECLHPRDYRSTSSSVSLTVSGGGIEKFSRNFFLTMRNDVIRGNLAWQAGEGLKWLITKQRNKHKPSVDQPVQIIQAGETRYEAPESHNEVTQQVVTDKQAAEHFPPPVIDNSNTASPTDRTDSLPRRKIYGSRIQLSFSFGGATFASDSFSGLVMRSPDTVPPLAFVFSNDLKPGWNLQLRTTIEQKKYFAHEFSYSLGHLEVPIDLNLIELDKQNILEKPSDSSVGTPDARIRQFAYNFLYNFTQNGSRIRPFLTIGPALTLINLLDSPFKVRKGVFRVGMKNIGVFVSLYDFGSAPPLEGGGILKLGFQFGGGVKFFINKRWLVRFDFRETITSGPDFWSKSITELKESFYIKDVFEPKTTNVFTGGKLQHLTFTGGVGISF